MNKIIAFLCLLTFIFPTPVIRGGLASTAVADQTPDISSIIAKYRQEIPQRMKKEKMPGLAIAVVDDQSILWAEGFGYTDWDGRVGVTPNTLFSIQSMSKSFTATAAMFAAQDGLVDLDAPITTYLPDFHVNSIFEDHPEQKITLRMLLSHTAGFPHEAPYGNNNDHPAYSFEQHVASISDTWLKFPVGTRYSYSNLGIDLAGYILQVRSGMPFTRYVQEKVLDPLGMTDTTLDPNQVRATHGRAIGHNAMPVRPPVDWLLIPSGGVWTTAEDLAHYVQFHINKGVHNGERLLQEGLAETMYTPPNTAANQYALGIIVNVRWGARHFEHGGGGFGFSSYMVWYPELKLGAVVLTNLEDSELYKLCDEVLDTIIDGSLDIYSQRGQNSVTEKPAYPSDRGERVISDNSLKALIANKALPVDDAAKKRRETYAGTYIFMKWGIPVGTIKIIDYNGDLGYTTPDESGLLTEVLPGLFFSSSGDTFDVRGRQPTAMNDTLIKSDLHTLPIKIIFYTICGLLFLSTLLFWPVRAVFRRIRRKNVQAFPSMVDSQRKRGLVWIGLLAGLASLFSLFCLGMIVIIQSLVYVPWPRPYIDLSWWQYVVMSLPYAALLLAACTAFLTGLAWVKRSGGRCVRIYFSLVAAALLAFNLAILI